MNTYKLEYYRYDCDGLCVTRHETIKADYYAIRQSPDRVEFIITKALNEPELVVFMLNFSNMITIQVLDKK